jgi:hypothetical protein
VEGAAGALGAKIWAEGGGGAGAVLVDGLAGRRRFHLLLRAVRQVWKGRMLGRRFEECEGGGDESIYHCFED